MQPKVLKERSERVVDGSFSHSANQNHLSWDIVIDHTWPAAEKAGRTLPWGRGQFFFAKKISA